MVKKREVSTSTRSKTRSRSRGRSKSPARGKTVRSSPSVTVESKSRSKSASRSRKISRSPARSSAHEKKSRSVPVIDVAEVEPQKPKKIAVAIEKSEKYVESLRRKVADKMKVADEVKEPESPVEFTNIMTRSGKVLYKQTLPTIKKGVFLPNLYSLVLIVLLPTLVFGINSICTKKSCSLSNWNYGMVGNYTSISAAKYVLAWIILQAMLAILPLGRLVSAERSSFKYRCNGMLALLVSFAILLLFHYCGIVPFKNYYKMYLQLAGSATIIAVLLSLFFYFHSSLRVDRRFLAEFYQGRDLNPRSRSFDWKFFLALRPGLIGWMVLNASFIAVDCLTSKSPNHALLLVVAFQALYVLDALFFEQSQLNTIVIRYQNLGFMLVFGHLVWVPFLYTLQTRYLLEHHQTLTPIALLAYFVLNMVGYWIYRASNSQKNNFRRDPHAPQFAHLDTIPTFSGRKLLASGWWGLVRHPNYLGDFIMSLAWTMPCGMASMVPFFYPAFMLLMLAHRSYQDDAWCREKYGTSWKRYCDRVKYRIIPYIF